ncbi:hypothetical protein TNIN_162971 [Trichonephila inaurata madagascariensis]|uniref:Uncharacterized protein n=1 Tax=Trichonephila inaurata madagascariensis TaxID=2747483 RepID=A0A8X7CH48_9ARAC|nr:hypothetical protein TNIN_162971 [Trichonephila inaurata madagascariensis]
MSYLSERMVTLPLSPIVEGYATQKKALLLSTHKSAFINTVIHQKGDSVNMRRSCHHRNGISVTGVSGCRSDFPSLSGNQLE